MRVAQPVQKVDLEEEACVDAPPAGLLAEVLREVGHLLGASHRGEVRPSSLRKVRLLVGAEQLISAGDHALVGKDRLLATHLLRKVLEAKQHLRKGLVTEKGGAGRSHLLFRDRIGVHRAGQEHEARAYHAAGNGAGEETHVGMVGSRGLDVGEDEGQGEGGFVGGRLGSVREQSSNSPTHAHTDPWAFPPPPSSKKKETLSLILPCSDFSFKL